jgi:hypothetical protein
LRDAWDEVSLSGAVLKEMASQPTSLARARDRFAAAGLAGALVLFGSDTRAAGTERADLEAITRVVPLPFMDLCGASRHSRRCLGKIVVDDGGSPIRTPDVRYGYGPSDLQLAYGVPASGANGKLIAIVNAFHYPNAEADVGVYRATFGLPPCTAASGCFRQVDLHGDPSRLPVDPAGCNGWAGESALDVQMAMAMCPDCRVLLVEVDDPNGDFSTAVTTAVRLGAVTVTNSYGGPDGPDDPAYNQPGILMIASTGDTGFGAGPSSPATYSGVVAVGGTTLTRSSSSRGWAEAAWSGGGSGCSMSVAKPPWQTDVGCSMRTEADVAAVADPSTGVAVYCSDTLSAGWQLAGGTSAAAPIVAGAFTIMHVDPAPAYVWHNPSKFFDVTSGSNGMGCIPAYLCAAGLGYDGPTGWGTPNGAALLGMTPSLARGDAAPEAGPSAGDATAAGADGCACATVGKGRGTAPESRMGAQFVLLLAIGGLLVGVRRTSRVR